MLTCRACGGILVSRDGRWVCGSFTANPEFHSALVARKGEDYLAALRNPVTERDKRIGINGGSEPE